MDDVGDDPIFAFLRTHQFFHRCPVFAQDGTLEVVDALSVLIEPFIDRALGGEALRDVAGFVFEIEDDFIGDGFVEFVGVDVGAEDFAGGFFLFARRRGVPVKPMKMALGSQRFIWVFMLPPWVR